MEIRFANAAGSGARHLDSERTTCICLLTTALLGRTTLLSRSDNRLGLVENREFAHVFGIECLGMCRHINLLTGSTELSSHVPGAFNTPSDANIRNLATRIQEVLWT